jgi:hypothetical protein
MLQIPASCREPLIRIKLPIRPNRVGYLFALVRQVNYLHDQLLCRVLKDLLRETSVTRLALGWLGLLDFRAAGLLLAHFSPSPFVFRRMQ